jgi:PAS domain S-box-containing protein
MEYKLLKEVVSELKIISSESNYKTEIKKNIIIDCLEIVKDIIYAVNDVITLYDKTLKILWVNKSCYEVFGYNSEEIILYPNDFIYERIHPDDKHIILKRNELINQGIEYTETIRFQHKNGHYVWLKVSDKVFKNKPDGSPFLFLGVATDITEIVLAEDTINHLSSENKKLSRKLIKCSISAREIEILELIAEGYPGKQIGDKLNISFNTVRTHRNNIMRKLNINCTAGLVNYYRENIKGIYL